MTIELFSDIIELIFRVKEIANSAFVQKIRLHA